MKGKKLTHKILKVVLLGAGIFLALSLYAVVNLFIYIDSRDTLFPVSLIVKNPAHFTNTPFIRACNSLKGKQFNLSTISSLPGYCELDNGLHTCTQKDITDYQRFTSLCGKYLTPSALDMPSSAFGVASVSAIPSPIPSEGRDYYLLQECIQQNDLNDQYEQGFFVNENDVFGSWECRINSISPSIKDHALYAPPI